MCLLISIDFSLKKDGFPKPYMQETDDTTITSFLPVSNDVVVLILHRYNNQY